MDGGAGDAIVLHFDHPEHHYLSELMREHGLSAQDMLAYLIRRAYLMKADPLPPDIPVLKPPSRSIPESSPRRKSARR